MAPSQLPVIDFSLKSLTTTTSSSWNTTCSEVMHAFEEHGVFIAMYNGVPQELIDNILHASRDLFDLPKEVKLLNTSDRPNHAYLGQRSDIPLFESLGIVDATTEEGVEMFTKLMWPSGNESFSTSALMFSKAVAKLEQTVMRMIAKSCGIEEHYESLRGSTTHVLRLQKYLCPQGNEEKAQGMKPHTDTSFMTILHQKQVKGLEVQTKDGEWIEVDLSPSSFIVMAGDACVEWSNGRIKAPLHRVMIGGSQERFSLGLFTFVKDMNSLPSLHQ